jgi:hypothetical protein
MLQTFLIYLSDSQREGRVITRRMRCKAMLWAFCLFSFLVALIFGIIAGAIYLAQEIGAGPAALLIAAIAFLLGVMALIILAFMNRRRVYAPMMATAQPNVAPLVMQSLVGGAMQSRPYVTLAVAGVLAFLAARPIVRK